MDSIKFEIENFDENTIIVGLVRIDKIYDSVICKWVTEGRIYPIISYINCGFIFRFIDDDMNARSYLISGSTLGDVRRRLGCQAKYTMIDFSRYDKETGIVYIKSDYSVELI